MSDYDTKRATRYLPHVSVATTSVVVMPVVVVWWLRSRGAITSPLAGVILAMVLSLTASLVGRAYWKRRRGPRDLLFGELLVWGWLRRVRMERQLAKSMELLRTDGLPRRGGGHRADRTLHILSQLAVALEAQDAYTDGHSRRVAAHAVMVARRMGLSGAEVSKVRAAAAVHDIGKVHIPADLLDKPDVLTSAEFELVKRHADAGAEIVGCLRDPELTAIVRHHHERFDGTGYPAGLAAERIPLGARIIAVADTFDALTSVRPYRPAVSHNRALEALVKASGTQLDPVAVRAFLRSYSGNKAIVFWSLLTISPQRALASLGGKRPKPKNVSLGPAAITVGAMSAIAVTAIGTPMGSRSSGPEAGHEVYTRAPRAVAAGSVLSAIGAQRTGSHHHGHRPTALPAPRRGHAAQAIGRVFTGSRIAAIIPLVTSSVHSRAPATRPARNSSSGSRPAPVGNSGGGPPGGSKGAPGGRSGAGSASVSTRSPGGGSGRGSPSGSGVAGAGGSGAGTASGPTGGSAGGKSGASSSASRGSTESGRRAGLPSTKKKCKHGGYRRYGFANQGQCVAFVVRGPR